LSSSAPADGTDTTTDVRLPVVDAQALAVRALGRIGMSAQDAEIVADHLVDAGLCGYRFASLPRILALAEEMRDWPAPEEIRIVHETPSSAMLDGGHHCGYVAVRRATEVGIEKAGRTGFAVVGVHNTFLSGRNAYYLEMVARAGLVGIHLAGAAPKVAPLGGRSPALGTNPIAFAVPSADGPVVFDMGTSALMWGEVQLAARLGQPLPPGCAVDAEGNPTTDAAAALTGAVLPFGGHKGFGLSLMVQVFSLLSGSYRARGTVQDYGFLHLMVDPGLLMPADEFTAHVAELVRTVRETPTQPGVAQIRIPGERGRAERERRLRDGLEVDRRVVAALEAL
jgi:LDH2 family malate/lactate/ureidoglycolate dehydrogenase